MVEEFDVHQFAGGDQVAGDGHVFRAGSRIAGRVVVNHDNGRGVFPDGGTQHLGRTDRAAVHRADVDGAPGHDLIAGIQQQHDQALLGQQLHFGGDQVGGVLGAGNLRPLLRGQGGDATAQLQGRHNLAGFGIAEAALVAQFGVSGAGQAAQSFKLGDDAGGEADGVFAGDAGSQQNGHQFGVVEVAGAVLAQTLAGSLVGRQLADGGLV